MESTSQFTCVSTSPIHHQIRIDNIPPPQTSIAAPLLLTASSGSTAAASHQFDTGESRVESKTPHPHREQHATGRTPGVFDQISLHVAQWHLVG